jgi:hypothetical protein
MCIIALTIYKFGFWDTLLSWDYQNWKWVDWTIYILGVLVYGTFFTTIATFVTLKILKKAGVKV